jgi:hypothetical protein
MVVHCPIIHRFSSHSPSSKDATTFPTTRLTLELILNSSSGARWKASARSSPPLLQPAHTHTTLQITTIILGIGIIDRLDVNDHGEQIALYKH